MKKFKLLLLSAFISFPCVASDNVGAETKEDMRTERNTGYFVYASGGASLIVSELEGVWDSGDPAFSGNLQLGFEWISKKKIGVGFMYDGYFTSFSSVVKADGGSVRFNEDWSLHYFAPQLAGRIFLRSERWVLNYSIGLGLFMSSECVKEKGKLMGKNYDYGHGSNLSFGVEFKAAPKLGIILGLSVIEASVKQNYGGLHEDSGLARVNLDMGLKYHF